MNKDVRLLNEALDVLKRLREWLPPDLYRDLVTPTLTKIRERLAVVETEIFMRQKNLQHQSYEKPRSLKTITPEELKAKIERIDQYEPDTVPNSLIEATTNFGIFDNKTKSEHCKDHPDAPHSYLKELSSSMGRYVCQCEFWSPDINNKKTS